MQIARLDQIKSLLDQNPTDSFLQFALAKEYEKLGMLQAALETYEKLLSYNPQYVGTYYHLGKLYELLDRNSDALKTFEAGMEIAKNQKDLHALSELQNVKTNLELDL